MAAPQSRVTLLEHLEVDAVGEDEFVNKILWQGGNFSLRAAYGGQVLGQSLMAACHTVADPDLLLLSAHCYFMSPVKLDSPVTYRVTRTKDGRVFSMRAIQVLQGGKMMSHCLASFKKPEPTNSLTLSHSPPGVPPWVYAPDDPRQDAHSKDKLMFNHRLPLSTCPFDSYYVFGNSTQEKILAGEPLEPRTMSWLKSYGSFPPSFSQNQHRVVLAFLSDFSMAFPLKLKYPTVNFKGALTTSLDHSIWFHDTVHSDSTWILQVVQCTQASEGTSLNSSHMYSDNGTLVATCQQQALFRLKSQL